MTHFTTQWMTGTALVVALSTVAVSAHADAERESLARIASAVNDQSATLRWAGVYDDKARISGAL